MARFYDFAGQQIIKPGAYTQRLFPVDQGAGSVTGKVLILGEASNGGVPFNAYTDVDDVVNVITGQAQALSVFGGGDLYYGAEFFLTPTKDARFNTPSQANCIVVNAMTQAGGTLKATSTPIIDVKFNKFGTDGNQAGVKISAGSTTGKQVRLIYKGTEVLNLDNVALPLLDIQYVGTGSAATIDITATKITTTCTGATGDNLDITLAQFTDLGSLINLIAANPAYTCTLSGKSDESVLVFDAVTAQEIKTAVYSCVGNVEAIIRAIRASDGFTASLTAAAARTTITNMTAYQFLIGGTVSAATTQNWTDALLKLEKYDFDNIVCMSGSATIHQLVRDHTERMNAVKIKKYRQCGFGSGSAVNTKALRIAEMKSLNSAYTEYCVSSFKRFDYVKGIFPTTDFDPYYLYPMIAGFRYANNVGMDVVFKYLNVSSTPEISDGDQEAYAAAGATVIQKTNNVLDGSQNFEIVINNTTYQGSQVTRTNPSVVYEINKMTKDYEERVIERIRALDSVANSVVIATIQNWISTYLFPKYRDDNKWITDFTDPVTGAKTSAFSNVSFYQDGERFVTKATFTMSVTPRFAFNFFTFITPGQNV